MSPKTQDLSQYKAVRGLPRNVIQTPTFLDGSFGEAVFQRYNQERETTFRNNPNLKLHCQDGVVTGRSAFDQFLVDQILREEVQGSPRTPTLAELADPRVLDLIRGKYYTSSRSLVLRGTIDSLYARNEPLARFLAEQRGIDSSRLEREPALITGLTLESWTDDETGYGLKLVPSDEFKVYSDDRFLERYNSYRFDETDDLGIPVGLDQHKGSRVWFTRKDGLSGLVLGRELDLGSGWYCLGVSVAYGRVVVVGGEATA